MHLVLDSTVLIDLINLRKHRREEMASLVEDGHTLCVAAINMAEVYAGMRSGEEMKTESLFETLRFYPMTEAIARRTGLLQNYFARRGRTLGLSDMMLAATALEHDLTLITDNIKDFPIPELKLHA